MVDGIDTSRTQSRKTLFLATLVALTIGTLCLSVAVLWQDFQELWVRHKLATTLRRGDQALIPDVVFESRSRLGTDEVVECLIDALRSGEPATRQSAAYAIWDYSVRYSTENESSRRLESPSEVLAAIPELTSALNDEDEFVRIWSASALQRIGPRARASVPILVELLTGRPRSREETLTAALALVRIDPPAGVAAAPAVLDILTHSDDHTTMYVAGTLAEIGEPIRPQLIESLRDDRFRVRAASAWALGRLGVTAEQSIHLLSDALNDEDAYVRVAACTAVWSIEHRPDRILTVLSECLNDPRPEVLKHASWCLGELGTAAKDTVPRLNELAQHKDGEVSNTAAGAVQKISAPAFSLSPSTTTNIQSVPCP
jgi:HEAT repeat protein